MLTPVQVRFPSEMLARIDAIRDKRLDRPERSIVIRELIAEGLAVREKASRR